MTPARKFGTGILMLAALSMPAAVRGQVTFSVPAGGGSFVFGAWGVTKDVKARVPSTLE